MASVETPEQLVLNQGVYDKLSGTLYIEKAGTHLDKLEIKRTIVYAFIDPNCSQCAHAWNQLENTPRHIDVRYIITGVLSPDSYAKAVNIVNADDEYGALDKAFNYPDHFQIKPVVTIDQDMHDMVLAHHALLNSLNKVGVPVYLYPDSAGKIRSRMGKMNFSNVLNLN